MANSLPTNNPIYQVNVWYVLNPGDPGFVFFGDVIGQQTDPAVHVAPGSQIVSFSLQTAAFHEPVDLTTVSQETLEANLARPEASAHFTTDPIQWVSQEGIPVAASPSMQVQRFDSFHFQLVDHNGNTNPNGMPHHLRLLVMHGGNIAWSPDPTVVNLPPDPPGD